MSREKSGSRIRGSRLGRSYRSPPGSHTRQLKHVVFMTLLVSRSVATPRDSSQPGYTKRPGGSSTRKHATEVLGNFISMVNTANLNEAQRIGERIRMPRGMNEGGRVDVSFRSFKFPVLTFLLHKFSENKLAPAIYIKYKQIDFNKGSVSYNRNISHSQLFILLSRLSPYVQKMTWDRQYRNSSNKKLAFHCTDQG